MDWKIVKHNPGGCQPLALGGSTGFTLDIFTNKGIIDVYMRTTLNISDALLEELRTRAARRKRPFREIVEDTLQKGLSAQDGAGKKIKLKTYPVGIKAPYQGMSLNQLYDQVEADRIQKVAES